MRILQLATCVLLGGVLMASGALKSIDAKGPVLATAAYDMLPAWAALVLGSLLPALEVVIGAALLSGWQRRAAAAWAIVLGVVFAIANASALSRGLVVDCQCFSGLGGSSVATALWIDGGIILFGVFGLQLRPLH